MVVGRHLNDSKLWNPILRIHPRPSSDPRPFIARSKRGWIYEPRSSLAQLGSSSCWQIPHGNIKIFARYEEKEMAVMERESRQHRVGHLRSYSDGGKKSLMKCWTLAEYAVTWPWPPLGSRSVVYKVFASHGRLKTRRSYRRAHFFPRWISRARTKCESRHLRESAVSILIGWRSD